jgi:hypothetical protein
MPACIVCKANYTPGDPCPRCDSDNSAWDKWNREEEKHGKLQGLRDFLIRHFYAPILIACCALLFGLVLGLLGMFWPGGRVKPYVLALTIVFTTAGCILIAQGAYASRFDLREEELLERVKRGWRKGTGPKMRALLAPVIAIVLTICLTVAIVKITMVWDLMEWLVFQPFGEGAPPSPEDMSLQGKVSHVFPLLCLICYVLTLIALAYSSSLKSMQEYTKRLSKEVPQPIFLQEDLLIKVVQHEAGRAVHREDPVPRVIGGAKAATGARPESRSWIWDEMERTNDGGIRLKAIVKAGSKTEESLIGERTEHSVYITYVVEADPWSRITKVVRMKETEEKK